MAAGQFGQGGAPGIVQGQHHRRLAGRGKGHFRLLHVRLGQRRLRRHPQTHAAVAIAHDLQPLGAGCTCGMDAELVHGTGQVRLAGAAGQQGQRERRQQRPHAGTSMASATDLRTALPTNCSTRVRANGSAVAGPWLVMQLPSTTTG